jgi:hypothetical protein
MKPKILALGLAALALGGCTQSIVMRNPTTGATAKCGPYLLTTAQRYASTVRESLCVEDFQRQGYVRTGD